MLPLDFMYRQLCIIITGTFIIGSNSTGKYYLSLYFKKTITRYIITAVIFHL